MNHHAAVCSHQQHHHLVTIPVAALRNEDIVPWVCGDKDHHFIHGLHPVIGLTIDIHQDTTGIGSGLYTVSGNVLDSIDKNLSTLSNV